MREPGIRDRLDRWVLAVVALCILALGYGGRLWLLRIRGFDPDEFEHLHAAWLIAKGQVIYRDFFEHHTPWTQFLLSPLYAFFRVDTNVSDAFALIFTARTLMWALTGGALALVFALGRRWRSTDVGFLAAAFLSNTIMYLEKTIEIRPDVLASVLLLGCLFVSVGLVQRNEPTPWWQWALSGCLLGGAVMATQKVLFVLPGFALAVAWHALDRGSPGTLTTRLRDIGWQIAGFAVPILVTVAYFAAMGGLTQFVELNFLLNLRWKVRFSPSNYLLQLLRQNPLIAAVGVLGTLRALVVLRRRYARRQGDAVTVLSFLSVAAGLYVMPVPYRQYYLLGLPLLALLASDWLTRLCALAEPQRPDGRPWYAPYQLLIAGAITALAVGLALWYGKAALGEPWTLPAIWAMAAAGAWLVARLRLPRAALAVLLIAASVYPLKQMRDDFSWTNQDALGDIEYVLTNSEPEESVMDGWTGRGVFRPHAIYHYFLHGEVRAMLTEEQKGDILARLRSGEVAPRLILMDGDLRGVSPDITAFLEERYEATGRGVIWQRRQPGQPTTSDPDASSR